MAKIKLSSIKPNEKNPRIISSLELERLAKSIKEFPQMMELRPIIVDDEGVILAGNMRYKALKQLKKQTIPEEWVKRASDLNEEQKKQFLIKDNLSSGNWDFQELFEDWDKDLLSDWGLDVPDFEDEPDYSSLDDEEIGDQVAQMTGNVKKAIQIEFELNDYETAKDLVKHFRDQEQYVGGLIIESLKKLKDEGK